MLELAPASAGAAASGGRPLPSVASACCHQVMELAVTGHVDGSAWLIDLAAGRIAGGLECHPDAITSVSMDQGTGFYLATGCHDGVVRTFDLRTRRCCRSLQVGGFKYDEAVHCVHLGRVLAAACADGSVEVFGPGE
ncbi:unnamed protein product [Prorocentrum cordatum]|uniref:Pre-mRNA-processing factor 19 n=1 Tax=Prorocentrum cordatum TaxID=2364126 RepID=A0ABN9RY99_9DINO|nr:unnamed protein product [Polarella glacialis]